MNSDYIPLGEAIGSDEDSRWNLDNLLFTDNLAGKLEGEGELVPLSLLFSKEMVTSWTYVLDFKTNLVSLRCTRDSDLKEINFTNISVKADVINNDDKPNEYVQ